MGDRPRYRSFIADSARWDGFAFREGDVVISTPPKCGTTWMQRICGLLIFQSVELDRPMAEISPWLDMQTTALAETLGLLEAQTHRRFIKTHTPLDGLPLDPRAVYLCVGRDPRDAGVSWDNHIANMDLQRTVQVRAEAVGLDDLAELPSSGVPDAPPPDDPADRLRLWIDDDTPPTERNSTLRATLHHLATFWEHRGDPNVVLFHYDDLTADLDGEMRRLAGFLGIEVAEERWPELVEAATFGQMKARAADLAPDVTHDVWKDTSAFFHTGTSGQWGDLLSEDDVRRYEERVASLVPPDLAAWAHGGWRGAGGEQPDVPA